MGFQRQSSHGGDPTELQIYLQCELTLPWTSLVPRDLRSGPTPFEYKRPDSRLQLLNYHSKQQVFATLHSQSNSLLISSLCPPSRSNDTTPWLPAATSGLRPIRSASSTSSSAISVALQPLTSPPLPSRWARRTRSTQSSKLFLIESYIRS